ncbi:transposase [Rubellimicrobium aerolatum]|nr:transposase [Rubellimicrobium aerolatum]
MIPNSPSRTKKHPFDRHLHKERHLSECRPAKLKQVRRVATRYKKTAQNYPAVATLAASVP